jgi:hypothetical protein
VLAEQGLTPADLDRALARLGRVEGTKVRTTVGINEDGVFGVSRAGWHPDLPDACCEPFIPLLWLKVRELLGRVPAGSTARFIQHGTLPPAHDPGDHRGGWQPARAEEHAVASCATRALPAEPPAPLRGPPGCARRGLRGGRRPRRAGPRSEVTADEDHPCERCHLSRDRRARHPAFPADRHTGTRQPAGSWLVPIADDTSERLERQRLPGESDDDLVSRAVRAYRGQQPS